MSVDNIDFDQKEPYYLRGYIIEAYAYFQGQKFVLFNLKKYLFWILVAILESIYYYMTLFWCLRGSIYFQQHDINYEIFSFILALTIIIGQNTKIPYLTFSWGFWAILGSSLTLVIVIVYVFATNASDRFGYLYVV